MPTERPPTIVVFSRLRWNLVFQRPQHLLSRLASRHRVVYVEEPVRSEGAPRLELLHPCDQLLVLRPHTATADQGFDDPRLHTLLDGFLGDEGIEAPILWFDTPMALPLMRLARAQAVVYDCVDESGAGPMRLREQQLLRVADLVLTGGPGLFQAKRALHDNVHCVPNSMDAAHFAPERITANCAEYLAAERLQSHILAPRLGFFGVIDERVDFALLRAIAQLRPDWHFVMVGPVVSRQTPPEHANLHWLGEQPYSRLPALVAAWDVCLLPYALNEHTRFVSPTKTLEYLAAEKPVVGTTGSDLMAMRGDVVRIAHGAEDFVRACAAVLAETPQQRAQRMARSAAWVSRFSWDESAQTVQRLIELALERRPRRRPGRATPWPPGAGAAQRPAASSSAGTW